MSRTFHHVPDQDRTALQAFDAARHTSFKRPRGDGRRDANRARACKTYGFAEIADDMDTATRFARQ